MHIATYSGHPVLEIFHNVTYNDDIANMQNGQYFPLSWNDLGPELLEYSQDDFNQDSDFLQEPN